MKYWSKRSERERNGKIPRDWWLEELEKHAILHFYDLHPLEGYRRLTFMMLDDDLVAVSPNSTYRVLKNAGLLDSKVVPASKKGTGFIQPTKIYQEWHVDVSYINTGGTFYFLISVLDGFSRYIVHSELSQTMKEFDIELIIAKAIEKHPGVKPRIISDNGPQFIANDFKSFVREYGLTNVLTSPYYPQSNGSWNAGMDHTRANVSVQVYLVLREEAERRIAKYVKYYNTVRLHSAIGYITPADCLASLSEVIGQERVRKLEAARKMRQEKRAAS
jgi:transposase InsO family protein